MRRVFLVKRSHCLIVLLLLVFLGACGKKSAEENHDTGRPTANLKSTASVQLPPAGAAESKKIFKPSSKLAEMPEPAGTQMSATAKQNARISAFSGGSSESVNKPSGPVTSGASLDSSQSTSKVVEATLGSDLPVVVSATRGNALVPLDSSSAATSTFGEIAPSQGNSGSGAIVSRSSGSSNIAATPSQFQTGTNPIVSVKTGQGAAPTAANRSVPAAVTAEVEPPVFKSKPEANSFEGTGKPPEAKKEGGEETSKIFALQSGEDGAKKEDGGEDPKMRFSLSGAILNSQPDQEMMGDLLNYLLAPHGITFVGHAISSNWEYHAKAGESYFTEARIDFSTLSEDGQSFVEVPAWEKDCQGKSVRAVFLGIHQKNDAEPLPFISALRSGNVRDLKKVQYQDYPIQAGCKIYPTDFPVTYDGMYAFFLLPEGQARASGLQTRDAANPKEWTDFMSWMGNPDYVYIRFNFVAKTVANFDSSPAGGKAKAAPLF